MHLAYYLDNQQYVAGVTLQDEKAPEQNNLALHACTKPTDVIHNREVLAAHLEQPLSQFVFATQTHSTNLYKVTKEDAGSGAYDVKTAISTTDALYTYEPNVVLTTMTADCVPLLFYHQQKGLIGTIHAGWKGLVAGIIPQTFAHLIEHEGCDVASFYVHIGPSLSRSGFAIDEDVASQFKQLPTIAPMLSFHPNTNKYRLDLKQVAIGQCEEVGIPKTHIRVDPMHTDTDPHGFSYRKDKQTGRHVSFIMKKH